MLRLSFGRFWMPCLGAFVAVSSVAWASTPVTYLGPPSSAVSELTPIGGFTRTRPFLREGGKPEFLVFTDQSPFLQVEIWAIVKALDQFGALSGARVVGAKCHQVAVPDHPTTTGCSQPTIDLTHAHYASLYLRLTYHRWVMNQGLVRTAPLRPAEARAVKVNLHAGRYRFRGRWQSRANILDPITVIGDYVQRGTDLVVMADLPLSPHAVPFADVQKSLRTGKSTSASVPVTFVPDTNEEANAMTALICHADGLRPRSVCTRPAIKAILRHVK